MHNERVSLGSSVNPTGRFRSLVVDALFFEDLRLKEYVEGIRVTGMQFLA